MGNGAADSFAGCCCSCRGRAAVAETSRGARSPDRQTTQESFQQWQRCRPDAVAGAHIRVISFPDHCVFVLPMRGVFICRGCARGGNTCVDRACGGTHCVSSRDGESDCASGCVSSLILNQSCSPSDGRGPCGIVASRRECQRRGCVVCPNGRCFPQTLACCWAKCENAASFVAHAAFQCRSAHLESAISIPMEHVMETALHEGGNEFRFDSILGLLFRPKWGPKS